MKGEDTTEQLLSDPAQAAQLADTARAAHLGRSALAARRRLGLANAELRRAELNGADAADLAELRAALPSLQVQANAAQALFQQGDVVKPVADLKSATLYGQTAPVPGKVSDQLPLTAALIGDDGPVGEATAVSETGDFTLRVSGDVRGARLQISDSQQGILFRDTSPMVIEAGQIAYREVSLTPAKPRPTPPPTVLTMPEVTRQTEDVACAILFQLGITEIKIEDVPGSATPGLVERQLPAAGTVLDQGAAVQLFVGRAGETDEVVVRLPDFRGLSSQAALERAKALGVDAELSISTSADGPPDTVIGQDIEPGTPISLIDELTLLVTASEQDDRLVIVPNVVGAEADQAIQILRRVGLREDISARRLEGLQGRVLEQVPEPDSRIEGGRAVTLFLGGGLRERIEPIEPVGPFDPIDRFDPVRPTGPTDIRVIRDDLSDIVISDDRFRSLGVDPARVPDMLDALGIVTRADAEAVVQMEPAEIRDKSGLTSLRNASRMRSMIRVALSQLEA